MHEAHSWAVSTTDDVGPGGIEALVTELATKNRIPRSRARRVVAAYDVDDRSPAEVRGALFTDYLWTLPAIRGALAHAAAGGTAHLLAIGPTDGAHAVHGSELHGIAGHAQPGSSDAQTARDTFVRDAVLALASGDVGALWDAVRTEPTTHGIGEPPYDPTAHALEVLRTFHGIARP